MAAAAVALALPAPALADRPTGGYLARLATDVRVRLDALVAAKAPRLVPPTPVAVKWRVTKVGSIELGGPLVALTAAELDGDPRSGELYAVTPRDVVAIAFRGGRPVEVGRVAFTGEPAVPAPRDVVGTAVVEGGVLVAAASPWARELRLAWSGTDKKTLAAQPGQAPFLVCPNERAVLAPGRNHFTSGLYNVRCRGDLVDRAGYPLVVRAELANTNKLAIAVQRCALGGGACVDAGTFELPKVGVAYEIADVDRDGTPELIVSDASAPGAEDTAKVFTLGVAKPRFKRQFNGGVAGLAVVDGDDADDVPEVVAAVRFPGSTRVDVWRLD